MNFQIKKIRDSLGLKQRDVAERLGITERKYGDYERGTNNISLEMACAIADIFNCSLDELAGRDFDARTFSDPMQKRLNDNWGKLSDKGREHVLEDSEAQIALGRTVRGDEVQEMSA